MLVKMGWFLAVFNAAMEKVVIPWKIKKEEGEKYNNLRQVTVQVVLHDAELDELNSSFPSDEAKAKIIVKGMRRNAAAQQDLVETA